MSARAFHSHSRIDMYDDELDELFAGERICQPRRRRSSMLSAAVAIVILSGCGFALWETKATWMPLLPADLSAVSSLFAPGTPNADAPLQPVVSPAPAIEQPLTPREVADAPSVEAGIPVPTPPAAADETTSEATTPDEAPSDQTAADEKPPARLPPPTVDASDPYQKRALAAGLHPDLSRVLLTRMTAADYRNAEVAIKTALAETPDGGVFVWPKGKPKGALFEVHFVKSAAHDCRRYVVTITKDRWSTTALPMETCGLSPPGPRNS
jgi:hypothetical protein